MGGGGKEHQVWLKDFAGLHDIGLFNELVEGSKRSADSEGGAS